MVKHSKKRAPYLSTFYFLIVILLFLILSQVFINFFLGETTWVSESLLDSPRFQSIIGSATKNILYECNDNKDNDGDGGCDFEGCVIGKGKNRQALSADVDCSSPMDNKEFSDCVSSVEICDGKDNDCDRLIDEDYATTPTVCGKGICSGTTGTMICDNGIEKNTCDPYKHAYAESCSDDTGYDHMDNNCDGIVDLNCDSYCDVDGDGYSSHLICLLIGYPIGDCDDGNALFNPGATDIPYNGLDENCKNGDLVDVDMDSYIATNVGGDDCNDYAIYIYPAAPEICNGKDDNCDNLVDENLNCVEQIVTQTCTPTTEICDGIDNDCDTIVDENLNCVEQNVIESQSVAQTQQNTTQPQQNINPPCTSTTEVCDGKDNDCDGTVDENCLQLCTDSDGGKNFSVKGTVTRPGETGVDYCVAHPHGYVEKVPSCSGTGCQAFEYYCTSSGSIGFEYSPYYCTCNDGACIS